MNGFLGTKANFWSDTSLLFTIILGMAAAFGGIQARKKEFSRHCPVMAISAFLNWIPVLLLMIPNWIAHLQGTNSLATGFLANVPIIHGVLGGFTQLLMTYTVTRMYWLKSLPPEKPIWLMRTTIIFWLFTVIGGLAVYTIAYIL